MNISRLISKILAILLLFSLLTSGVDAQETTCRASNPQEFGNCVAQFNSGTISAIEVTNRITCNPIQPCNFIFTSTTGGKVFGTPGTDAGFFRTGAYNRQVISMSEGASNITLSDLEFNDDTASGCVRLPANNCVAQIAVNGTGITIQRLTMRNSKQQAITAGGTNLKILDSTFYKTYSQEVWIGQADTVLIEGNTFSYGGGSGNLLSGRNYIIKNNTYERNQWNPPWIIQGGQIYLRGEPNGLVNVLFTNNRIINGFQYLHFTSGIEMTGVLTNVTISNNYIHNNTGSGIVAHSTEGNSNVVIENNEITGNRTTIDDLSGRSMWTARNNCFADPCPSISTSADLNNNGRNDVFDYNIFVENFKKAGSGLKGDFVKNGIVDINDHTHFISLFQGHNPPPIPTPPPPAPSITINSASIHTDPDYAKWNISAMVSNLGNGSVYALIYDKVNSRWWSQLATVSATQDRQGIVFYIPPAYTLPACNENSSCSIGIRLINYDTLASSNEYLLTLPQAP